MPHQCTACGYTFADGSKEMLGGCPECGGNTFQFQPDGEAFDDPTESDAPPESADPGGTASTVGRAATKVRDFVSREDDSDGRSDTDGDAPTDGDVPTAGGDTSTEPTPSSASSSVSTSDSTRNEGDSEPQNTPNSGDTDGETPSVDAPWPDSSDAADPIRRGGLNEDGSAIDDEAEDGSDATSPTPNAMDKVETSDSIVDKSSTDADIIDADAAGEESDEDRAQASARSDTVSDDELADAGPLDDSTNGNGDDGDYGNGGDDDRPQPSDGRVVSEPSEDETDMSELREQLNDQFESIKIVEPGQYELNLMELYDRDEYIIALRENGRYVIQMPEEWLGDRDIGE